MPTAACSHFTVLGADVCGGRDSASWVGAAGPLWGLQMAGDDAVTKCCGDSKWGPQMAGNHAVAKCGQGLRGDPPQHPESRFAVCGSAFAVHVCMRMCMRMCML